MDREQQPRVWGDVGWGTPGPLLPWITHLTSLILSPLTYVKGIRMMRIIFIYRTAVIMQ